MEQRVSRQDQADRYQRYADVICDVPRGRVVTYGDVARLARLPGRAREVGRMLSRLPHGSSVPWHRVVGASGAISERGSMESEDLQAVLLESEGIDVDASGRLDLPRFRWPRGGEL